MRVPILHARPEHLWHYTCSHGRAELGGTGMLHPAKDLLVTNILDSQDDATKLIASYGWFTSLGNIDKHSAGKVGLNKISLKCERWEFRYRVSSRAAASLVPWTIERLTWPEHIATALENDSPDADPASWYMSRNPTLVFYDPIPAPTAPTKTGWAALS